ncbi:MAG: phage head closure protein [Acidaminococcaceae bacterium]
MDIGKLDKRVAIYQPVATNDGQGGRSVMWQEFLQVWAEFKRPRFVSANVQGAPAALITQGIKIRDVFGICTGWQVRYSGKKYEILHVDDSVPGELMLTTQEVQK